MEPPGPIRSYEKKLPPRGISAGRQPEDSLVTVWLATARLLAAVPHDAGLLARSGPLGDRRIGR